MRQIKFLLSCTAALAAVWLLLVGLGTAAETATAAPLANDLRISQVYGGGGNSGAPYTHDFIEIFNAGTISISLDGLSLQYASGTGTGNIGASATQLTELPDVSLAPGQYYLVQQASGANGAALPTPDHIDPTPISMSGTAGKAVLVTGITGLGCNGGSTPCDAGQLARIIDLVGFGTTTNFFEGSGPAPQLSNTTAAIRAGAGCVDTDDNAADFTAAAPTPRNSASPVQSCIVVPSVDSTTPADGAINVPVSNTLGVTFNEPVTVTANWFDLTCTTGGTIATTSSATPATSYTITPSVALQEEDTCVGTVFGAEVSNGDSLTMTADYTFTFSTASLYGDITFVYHDLEDVVLPGEAIYLAGSFNGFDNTALLMTADANNTVFTATVAAISGTVEYKYVVDIAGNKEWDWLNNGPNRSHFVVGDATVDDYRNVTSGYANLNSSDPITTRVGVPSSAIYGETFYNNVTNPAGAARGLVAEVGYGNNTNLASWTWFPTTFNVQIGNNDEYAGVVTPSALGTYSYTIRFNGNSGVGNPNSTWVYADDTGVGPYLGGEFSFSDLGVIMVEAASCGDPATLISTVQGSGNSSPIAGQNVTVEAVVVSNFQGGTGTLNGFHIQEELADQDGNPATSEGIFVFNSTPVTVGDLVRVTGTVAEFNSGTQLSSASVVFCNVGNVVTPTLVTLPLAEGVTWERYEGMLIELGDVVATDNFRLGRFGQVRLSPERLAQPTNVVAPGAPANALQALNNRSYLTLDDARTNQNPDPMIYPAPELSYINTLRGGDVVTQVIGIVDHFTGSNGGDPYRLQPTQPVSFVATNLRQETPPNVGGMVQVASFNVLNYFSTLDGNGNICGPLGDQNCRGADSALEFERQYTKIVTAIVQIDAAVIGLMEIENHVADAAVIDLVTRLNAVAGAGVYDYIATGSIGSDAIKQAIIYQPALVTPVGAYAILDSSVDPRFDDTRNRPVIIQTFEENSSGEHFTVAVNHLKSKGSACSGDPDLGDGQGNCNVTRTEAAEALVDYLADPANNFSQYTLIIGDLNAYAMEDPIMAIQNAGYTNLVSLFGGLYAYGYQFDGQWGYLDHALASDELLPFVTGTSEWHINADEPIVLDYNTEFKTPNQVNTFFGDGAFRSSDHDPVIVGLDFSLSVIDIETPSNGDVFTVTVGNTTVDVPMTITTTNFAIPTDGHWHLSINGADQGPVMGYTTTVALAAGSYTLTAELYAPDHTPLGVMDSVVIEVVEETIPTDPTALRISQLYGGGGNSGATFTHDYIEIFNSGDTSVNLNGLSLQYASPTGTGNFGANANLLTTLPNVMLLPGQYYLVQQASGGAVGAALPTPDHTGTIAMGAAGGKVVLVTGTTSLGCNGSSTICDGTQLARIIDLVGYGTANFFEGSAAAPTLSSVLAGFRAGAGCVDTDDNGADFSAMLPAPRNTSTPVNSCEVVVPPTVVSTSPITGAVNVPVTTTLMVTFSEPVTVTAVWFDLSCTVGGDNLPATYQPAGPATSYTITPDSDLAQDDTCVLTVFGDQVENEQNATMTADYLVSFATVMTVPTPTVAIETPSNGDVFTVTVGNTTVDVPLTITTTNFAIPTDGHWHLHLNGVDQGPVMGYTTTVALAAGSYTLTAELYAPDHTPLGVMDSVVIEVVDEIAPPTPTVSIVTPENGDVFTVTLGNTTADVSLTITTTNFAIPTDGHWHWFLDGVDQGPVMGYTTTLALPVGEHEITVELHAPDHTPLGITATVTVTVVAETGPPTYTIFLPLISR